MDKSILITAIIKGSLVPIFLFAINPDISIANWEWWVAMTTLNIMINT